MSRKRTCRGQVGRTWGVRDCCWLVNLSKNLPGLPSQRPGRAHHQRYGQQHEQWVSAWQHINNAFTQLHESHFRQLAGMMLAGWGHRHHLPLPCGSGSTRCLRMCSTHPQFGRERWRRRTKAGPLCYVMLVGSHHIAGRLPWSEGRCGCQLGGASLAPALGRV
jgi:hypothetical protein